jgi:hypothetical protein
MSRVLLVCIPRKPLTLRNPPLRVCCQAETAVLFSVEHLICFLPTTQVCSLLIHSKATLRLSARKWFLTVCWVCYFWGNVMLHRGSCVKILESLFSWEDDDIAAGRRRKRHNIMVETLLLMWTKSRRGHNTKTQSCFFLENLFYIAWDWLMM